MSYLVDKLIKLKKEKDEYFYESLHKFESYVKKLSSFKDPYEKYKYFLSQKNDDNYKRDFEKEIKDFYLSIPDEKLPELLYYNGFKFYDDFDILKELGYPKIRFTIPTLFEMIADINWPCSLPSIELLNHIGNPIVYHTEELFKSTDYEMISRALSRVIIFLDTEYISVIKNQLLDIIKMFDIYDDEISNYAFLILFKNKLISKDEIKELINLNNDMNLVMIQSLEYIKDLELKKEIVSLVYEINNLNKNSLYKYLKSKSIENSLLELIKELKL